MANGQQEEHEARQISIRNERSLRPRKPIQEHPYQLENALYRNSFTKHGVKPLRIAPESGNRQTEYESQDDTEFEPESQERGLPDIIDEILSSALNNTADEHNSLPLPSSSPLKTTPLHNRAGTSSLPSSQGDTDSTSVDDQDLPDIEELLRQPLGNKISKVPKRKTPLSQSVIRKRRRHNVLDSDPPEPYASSKLRADSPTPHLSPIRKPQHSPNSPLGRSITKSSRSATEALSPSRGRVSPSHAPPAPAIEISSEEEGEDMQTMDTPLEDSDASETQSEAETDRQILTTMSRRIRGVLPASWLRLDQQSGREKVQKNSDNSRRRQSPDREIRRGVAQTRQTITSSTIPNIFFEESDDEPPATSKRADEVSYVQTKISQGRPFANDYSEMVISDGEDTVIEEDAIDHMFPAAKRQLRMVDQAHKTPRQGKSKHSSATPAPQKSKHQSRITSHMDSSRRSGSVKKSTTKTRVHSAVSRKRSSKASAKPTAASKRMNNSPPSLSILDVIEPGAPLFLKIAARTAKRRSNQGRSSPRKKSIKLATRQDHVDAVSVLNDWVSGSIKQRPSVSSVNKRMKMPKQPAQLSGERQTSSVLPPLGPWRAPIQKPRKLVKHVSNGGTVSYKPPQPSRQFGQQEKELAINHTQLGQPTLSRPAQLEMDETDMISRYSFHSKKKFLDNLYRRGRENLSIASSVGDFELNNDLPRGDTRHISAPLNHVSDEPAKLLKTSRFRKKSRPHRIDIEAPHYTHADDPLPTKYPTILEPLNTLQPGQSKLRGLGPYGTNYSHHFEIFPLDSRAYFHESTLIGSGVVDACHNHANIFLLTQSPRQRVFFNLGEQVLRWGPWNDQVSSELGVVLDFIAEQLESVESDGRPPNASVAVEAAGFLLKYVKDSMSVEDLASIASFTARLREVVHCFNDRIRRLCQNPQNMNIQGDALPKVYDHLLLMCLIAMTICRGDSSLSRDQMQMEELLRSVANTTASMLLHIGLDQVKDAYNTLKTQQCRERGFRGDTYALHSWTLLMKVVDLASIPRGSFWDILQLALISENDPSKSFNAQDLERIWEAMFILLPLVDFNNIGVIIATRRQGVTRDGWVIPHILLKRVFQLYQEDPRQGPSFNNYCRALVGRCHYLVQQWGWRRSAVIVGVIFDFFGAQDLAHLRNEEVYRSPQFLEMLAGNPRLDIEPEDRCFHVFLKLLALSICKLREIGSDKDIRNLVVRTTPNHIRQYLKEQTVHERDLAALRNHHDLLVTLYWASPPDMRPQVTLIQGLVTPASSHKEACLINVRAWNQLARFIVASGEATTSFKPFNDWRNVLFQQSIDQSESVAADIQQQLVALARDVRTTVSNDMVSAMIALNKAAVMDVLHISIASSLDVMRHAPDLEAATFCLSTFQLQRTFGFFAVAPPDLDWGILRPALSILATFLCKIDEFKATEESQQSESQILISAQADDALLVLDHDISRSFFLMAKCVLSSSDECSNLSVTKKIERTACLEQIVQLAARLASRFIESGTVRLSNMFKIGKYGLFDGLPHTLDLEQRRYLVLFISALLKHGFTEFSTAGFSLSEVWALSLVKPQDYLEYENQLAEQLGLHGKNIVPEAVIGLSTHPSYNSNRNLFEFLVSAMRRSIRDAGPSLRKIIIAEHSKSLKQVMDQIQRDLGAMSQRTSGHHEYVVFVRDIISLIRAHGSDFCTVDDFFYQISKEYSPSAQDPQLQVAGMVSYGVRLGEGDTRVAHQLFFFLFNNFKVAMASGKLEGDVDMLRKGMKTPGILDFVLGKMLPAIIRASFIDSSVFPILDVYVEALWLLLTENLVGHEICVDDIPHLAVTARAIVEGMCNMYRKQDPLSGEQAHVIRQLVVIVNLLWPSINILHMLRPQSSEWSDLSNSLDSLKEFAGRAETYIHSLLEINDYSMKSDLLFAGLRRSGMSRPHFDNYVKSFTDNIVQDVTKNWIVGRDKLTIQTPGKARGLPSTQQGVNVPVWEMEDIMQDLHVRIRECRWWGQRASGVVTSENYCCDAWF